MDYSSGYLGDPRGRADAIADNVRDDHMNLDFKTEVSLSDAVKNSSSDDYSTRALEELSHDVTQEAIRSAPTAGDAWAAVRNARSFLTKEPTYKTGLRKARRIGSTATSLGALAAMWGISPIVALMGLAPQDVLGVSDSDESTLTRANRSLWDLVLPGSDWDEDDDYELMDLPDMPRPLQIQQ